MRKMNDRIRECAWEAGILAIANKPDGSSPTKLEKFAELIVRECVELNNKELSFEAFEKMLKKYEEHFGIKI